MSRPQRSRLSAAILLAAVAALGVAGLQRGWALGDGRVVAGFLLTQALCWALASRLQPNDIQTVVQLDEALFVAGLVLLPPTGVVVALAVGAAIGSAIDRMPLRAMVINGGILALAMAAAVTTIEVATGTSIHQAPAAASSAAAAAACVVMALCSDLLLACYFRFALRHGFSSELTSMVRERVPRIIFLVSIGVVSGVAGRAHPAFTIVSLPLLLGLVLVLGQHSRATRDRERAQGLFEASIEVHSSVDRESVTRALIAAAGRLLRCASVRVSATAAEPGEWGAKLGANNALWLVVSDPTTLESLDREALNLLEALAAVGAAALDNVELVERISYQAVHDPLTGLANQVLFEDRVSQAVAGSRRNRERFAVMVLDLDSFKKVNDSLGHPAGNELLRLMADRLAGSVREIDTVARLGSDHFTLLFPGLGDPDQCGVMAEKLLAVIRRPVMLDGHELFMTASAGVAFYPEDGTRPEHLLRNADGAMHRAKEMGRDTFQVYASGMNEAAHMRLVRESELHQAMLRDELRIRYQPQVDLRTGEIVGVEALVRWEHPVLGLIGPDEFVPLAEESGLIVAVDRWVLLRACRQAREWQRAGLPPLRMAVNLSGRHFQANDRLLETVSAALDESGLDPTHLELEVTEGIAVGEEEGTGRTLQRARELGVKVAIDDFGTGYSMLGRLQTFPIDRLKIDKSFVAEITSPHGDAPIVAAMIAMSRSLGIEVVAEGVETDAQRLFLRSHGCDHGQGFLFSPAVEADEVVALLRGRAAVHDVTLPS